MLRAACNSFKQGVETVVRGAIEWSSQLPKSAFSARPVAKLFGSSGATNVQFASDDVA